MLAVSTACTSTSTAPPSSAPAAASSAAPALPSLEPSAAPEGGGITLGGSDLPEQWPVELPAYTGGQLMTAVVSDDQLAINATWSTDAALSDAFAAMETALLASGFLPTSQTGGADMLIETADLSSNDYSSDAFDVNLTVVAAGEQATVMLNASRR